MVSIKLGTALLSFFLLQSAVLQENACRGPAAKNGGNQENASSGASKEMKPLSPGQWGGPHINFSAKETGAAIEWDCAHGTIAQKIELDQNGRFDVRGTYQFEGGPVRMSADDQDGKVRSDQARYRGRVAGKDMTFTVTLVDTGRVIGTFSLVRGETTELTKCL